MDKIWNDYEELYAILDTIPAEIVRDQMKFCCPGGDSHHVCSRTDMLATSWINGGKERYEAQIASIKPALWMWAAA